MKEIEFCDHGMILHHHGVLFWPAEKIAIVSDLHLEKASHLAQAGQFLPPQDSYETLLKLKNTLEFADVKTLIFLGDSFHDAQGYDRMDDRERAMFTYFCETYHLIWITGNHDEGFIPCGVDAYDEVKIQSLTFRHIHKEGDKGQISGHYHPKARLKIQGRKISRPCFIHNDEAIIMPAFGSFTGGLYHNDPVFKNIFPLDYCLGILGQRQLYYFSKSDFENRE
jgi:DNA ligase-associated metallophosphoesterase